MRDGKYGNGATISERCIDTVRTSSCACSEPSDDGIYDDALF